MVFDMNKSLKRFPMPGACAGFVCLLTLPFALVAADGEAPRFPPVFFPGLEARTEQDVYLQGLVRLYPGRLLDEEPESLSPAASREPLVEELPGKIAYVRVYDLAKALPALEASGAEPALIWDFRYLATPVTSEAVAGLTQATRLLGAEGLSAASSGGQGGNEALAQSRAAIGPVIVLVNHRTRGGVEAALDALQRAGTVMTVGTRTAGMTGAYRPLEGQSGYWIIEDELLAVGGDSLLGHGLKPKSLVDVTPEADFLGYQLIESGQSPEAILRLELPGRQRAPRSEEEGDSVESNQRPADPVLQRAVEIIVALRVLGRLPGG